MRLWVVSLFLALIFFRRSSVIEIQRDSELVSTASIRQTLSKNVLPGGFFYLPGALQALAKIPMVKTVVIKYPMRIKIFTYKPRAYLAALGIIIDDFSVVEYPYNNDNNLIIYDAKIGDIKKVNAWHLKNIPESNNLPAKIIELAYDHVSEQWRILFDNNTLLLLGHTNIASLNFKRWLELLPYLHKHNIGVKNHIFDLRYPNGFAYSSI